MICLLQSYSDRIRLQRYVPSRSNDNNERCTTQLTFLNTEHSRVSSRHCAKRTSCRWLVGVLTLASSSFPFPSGAVAPTCSTVTLTSSGRKWRMSKTALSIGRPSRSSMNAVSTGHSTPSARCSSVDFSTRKSDICSKSSCNYSVFIYRILQHYRDKNTRARVSK